MLLRDRHPEDAELGEPAHVLPGKGAVHVLQRARPELALRKIAYGLHKTALLIG
jgi:hypothetical protein